MKPQFSIPFEIYGGKVNPNMCRNIIHGEVFLTLFSPNLRMLSSKFREINFGEFIIRLILVAMGAKQVVLFTTILRNFILMQIEFGI